jgi:GABA permease
MPGRILIVANQTLGGENLAATVRERVAAGATELWIVVPATQPRDHSRVSIAGSGAVFALRDPTEAAYDVAERRLAAATEQFRGLGVELGGEVGDEDPFTAITNALAHREVDEVIISTLPSGASHWLRTDLPSRVHRNLGLPVTTVLSRVSQHA